MQEILLENDTLAAVFDKDTGCFLHLLNKSTGCKIQRRKSLARSFDMLVPLRGRRNNHVIGLKQACPRVEVGASGMQLVFMWDSLRSEHGGVLNIAFRATVTLEESRLTFGGEVVNKSPCTVEAVGWPCLGDLSRPRETAEFQCEHMCLGSGLGRTSLFPGFKSTGYWGVDFPQDSISSHLTPFVLVSNENEGLYIGNHDTTLEQLVHFHFCWEPGYEYVEHPNNFGFIPKEEEVDGRPVHLAFSVQHLPFLGSGNSGPLNTIVLEPYQGNWHRGVDCYKKWRRTWFTPAGRKPAWASEVHAWQQLHINSPEDELRCRYGDLVEYGREASRHGVKAIQLVGWTQDGQDRGNPSHDIDPRLGTWEELRNAIAEIQKMGVKVVLFNKYTWSDQSTQWFKDDLNRYATRDPYGNYHVTSGYKYQTITQLADINLRRLISMCHSCAAWREIANGEFRKSLALGAVGMLYDEGHHHGNATYCFDADHGHRVPANVYAGDARLAEGFHDISKDHDPEYLYAGEACYDLEFRHYHLSYFRINPSHMPVSRYIDPDSEMMVAVVGLNDRNTINLAMLYRYIISYEPRNFKGRLDEFPRTLAYGKSVDRLRARYSAYLWDAEFTHTQGARVKADGNRLTDAVKPMREQKYSVFRSRKTGKTAVIVVNTNHEKKTVVEVEPQDTSAVYVMVTPETPDPVETDRTVILDPLSAAVFLEA